MSTMRMIRNLTDRDMMHTEELILILDIVLER